MKEDGNPKVSIIMPVYNGEKFLEESIRSVLDQTFADFELIIINDSSTDNSPGIIKKYIKKDKRIRPINNRRNMGWIKSVNEGLKAAKGKYIACWHADDLSHPKRIEVEYDYLEKHPNIFLTGTSAVYVNEKGEEINRFRKYDDYKMLAWRLKKSCSIVYSSIMFRNERIYFDNNFGSAADYHFYYKLLKMGKNLTNIPPFLVKYRVHPGNMSIQKKKEQELLGGEIEQMFKELNNINLLNKINYSIRLFFHYISTINEKKILKMDNRNQ